MSEEQGHAGPDNKYTPPASPMADAIQYPMHDRNFGPRIVNAFMCEWHSRNTRKEQPHD